MGRYKEKGQDRSCYNALTLIWESMGRESVSKVVDNEKRAESMRTVRATGAQKGERNEEETL
jgi:hypothetical protein